MLYCKIITVHSENHTELKNAGCEQNEGTILKTCA